MGWLVIQDTAVCAGGGVMFVGIYSRKLVK